MAARKTAWRRSLDLAASAGNLAGRPFSHSLAAFAPLTAEQLAEKIRSHKRDQQKAPPPKEVSVEIGSVRDGILVGRHAPRGDMCWDYIYRRALRSRSFSVP